MQNFYKIVKICFYLLCTNFINFKNNIMGKVINTIFIVIPTMLIAIYILPIYGICKSYGVIKSVTAVISAMYFSSLSLISDLLLKMGYDRKINYYILLPIPFWSYCVQLVISYTLYGILVSFITIPFIILILFKQIAYNEVSWFMLSVSVMLISFLSSSFGLLLAAYTKGIAKIENVFVRILIPLAILGGGEFSWSILNSKNKFLSYISLLNPYTYSTEIVRSSFIAKHSGINFYIALFFIMFFSLLFIFFGINKLKRRLSLV